MVQKVQFCGSAQLQANYWKNKQTHLRKQYVRAWKVLQGLRVPRVHLELDLLQRSCSYTVVKKRRCRSTTWVIAFFREVETPDFGIWAVQVPGKTLKTRYPSGKTLSITLVWMINFILTDCSKILRSGRSGYTNAWKCRGFCNLSWMFHFLPCLFFLSSNSPECLPYSSKKKIAPF